MRARRYGRAIRSDAAFSLLALAGLCSLCGCAAPDTAGGDYPYERLAAPYRQVQLKTGTTLDVLGLLDSPKVRMEQDRVAVQLLTQSDTSAALSGKSKDGKKIWVNLVAFDEYRMTARRKYFFLMDEQPAPPVGTQPPTGSVPGVLAFDAQFVLDPEIGTALYATDEARKAAIVRALAQRFKGDVDKLAGPPTAARQTDAIVATAGMMMNQVFQGVLAEFDQSSALAKNLNNEEGVAFGHRSLGEGRMRLLVTSGIGTVAVRIHQPMPSLPTP
jgi:hypothetical protein